MTDYSDYSLWYHQHYHELSGSGLWLRGGELNALSADEYDKRPFRVLISRLSTAFDTAESITHRVLYQIARSAHDVFPDVAFLPPPGDGEIMKRDNVPWLLGTNTKKGPQDFDLVALSNSIVQELVNIIPVLKASGIPIDKNERLADASLPLIILGGANALSTSLLWHDNPPVDGIFVGESPEMIRRLFELCAGGKSAGLPKQRILDSLRTVPGFFEPDELRPVTKHRNDLPATAELPPDFPAGVLDNQPGRGVLQISEGCPCFCSFCSESWGRKPYREAGLQQLITRAREMKKSMGLDRIDLYSFNFNMHSQLYPLLWELTGMFKTVGLKSQRFDYLAHDPGMLDIEHVAGKSSVTCGLEGISPRLRRYLQKALDEADLRKSLALMFEAPLRELKMFLLATGREQDEDFDEFRSLLDFIASLREKSGRSPRIIFSVTPLVRFPWTPLEFDDAPTGEQLKPIISRIHAVANSRGFEVRLAMDPAEYELSQMLARARDPRIMQALIAATAQSGFVYYREIPAGFVQAFKQALEERKITWQELLKGHSPDDTSIPWAAINPGVSRDFLERRYRDALNALDNGYCLGMPGSAGTCAGCGACEPGEVRERIVAPRDRSPYSPRQLKERIAGLRGHETDVRLVFDVAENARGLPRRAAGAALAAALMRTEPALVEAYRGYRSSLWEDTYGSPWVTGDDIITLCFLRNGIEPVDAIVADPESVAKVNRHLAGWGLVSRKAGQEPVIELEMKAELPFDGEKYCRKERLTFTRTKSPDGSQTYAFTPAAIKRKVVSALNFRNDQSGQTIVRMRIGPRFSPKDFAQTAFALRERNEWVRVGMRAALDC
jgi:radical SAM superfamily enzyme YgiQ (UPF0313 family)